MWTLVQSLKFPYLLILSVFWVFLAIFIGYYGYYQSFYLLNATHFSFLDTAMGLISHIGDGVLLLSLSVFLVYSSDPARWFILLTSSIFGGLLIQFLKQVIFIDWLRPLHYWGIEQIHVIPGHILYGQSFPSGHTMAATLIFTGLALFYAPKKGIQFILVLGLICVSYSRIYVGAHFPGDVLVSSVLGTCIAFIFHLKIYPLLSTHQVFFKTLFKPLKITAFTLLFLVPILRVFNLFPF